MPPWQIMFILFVVTALINFYRVDLENKNEKPGLQNILLIIQFITGFLSLPVTFVGFAIIMLYMSRKK